MIQEQVAGPRGLERARIQDAKSGMYPYRCEGQGLGGWGARGQGPGARGQGPGG
jgi:hypothetical protein